MRLSIVATLFRSAPYIEEFHRRASAAANSLVGEDYEIVLVEDGSPDNSLDIAVQLTENDSHVVVVDLSRNFGHHKAMMTGLAHARGRQIFLIDVDLEEEPEWLVAFADKMENEKCDVVYGIQEKRKGGFFEQVSGTLHYEFLRVLAGFELPKNLVTARLMSRRYVDALLRHEEREIVISGLWLITGFEQRPVVVKKHNLRTSTYTFRRKVAQFVNTVTSFSNAPLIVIFYMGIAIFLLASIYIAYLIVQWLYLDKLLGGWTSVMASIWLLGGLIISFIGIVGIYVSKIFTESKRRPYTIVRAIHGKQRRDLANMSDSSDQGG